MWRTRVGYAGGETNNPTYRAIADHTEALQIDYDPQALSFGALLDVYWSEHLPCRPSWSRQYAAILFHHDAEQKQAVLRALDAQREKRGELYVDVLPIDEQRRFWVAEDYHQKYYLRQTYELNRGFVQVYPEPAAYRDSPAAARLNGYLGGYGNSAQLSEEIELLGLSPKGKDFLARLLARRP